MKLPDLLSTITIYQNAARKFAADCRKAAADADVVPALRENLLRLADEADAVVASGSFSAVTTTSLDELTRAILSGRAVITHQATDLFS